MLLAGMLAMGVSAQAQLEDGKYYLQNVNTSLWWGCGNDWGTRASLVKHPEYVMLYKIDDGKYKMETQVANGDGEYYFEGDYMDNVNAKPLTFAIDGGSFTIAHDDGQLYGYDGSSTILGKNITGDNALWNVFTHEELAESLKVAKVTEPRDATFMILDPNFGRNNRNASAWEGTGLHKGGDNKNFNTESYMAAFDVNQTLTGLPKGVYKLDAQAAVTYHDDRAVKEYDGQGAPVIYANDETVDFAIMLTADQLTSQTQLSNQFGAGKYQVEPIYILVGDDGILKIGAKSERADIWAVWDNFELTYYGDCTIDAAKNAAIFAQLEELRGELASLLASGDVEIEAVKTELQNIYDTTDGISDLTAAQQAINNLKDAINKGKAFASAKDILAKMKQLVESTNVYTQEAYDNYYGTWAAKYKEGTLTTAEASALEDPFAGTGWHAPITCDNFLLSAWDTNPDFQNAPYYINTWSVEGNNDGSEFRVPFFEYWTGDDTSLGERTLTATMENLKAGEYDVTALVRVRTKNNTGADTNAYGISLQANDGEAADVTKGALKITLDKDNNFYIGEFTARGTVGDDGVLKIKFNVAADNNISWLSFKNVKFAKYVKAPIYSLKEGDVFKSGQTVEVKDGDLTVATITYGEDGGADFNAAAANGSIEGYTAFTSGNGTNGNKAGGTFYTINPLYSGTIDVAVVLNANKAFYILEDGTALSNYDGITVDPKYYGTYSFDVTAGKSYKIYCAGSKLGFFGFDFVYDVTTGISTVKAATTTSNTIFNLQGQKVTNAQKGLYIINGRKVVIK